ncbi:MAG: YjgP/YjgQ family permease [Parvularculaceae bacterium]|nr:YjgP/YjgQ family permease [Parvularculaceae bacterium]
MSSLDKYLFRQCLTPFLVAAGVVTAIIWTTQSLQRADIIVEHGKGLLVFARLSVLIIPSLLSVILPFALFAGALYAFQRLHADSEIAVMFAAGVSRLRIGAPLLLIAAAAAAATLWINLDLMPSSYRLLKREIADMRADIASAVLRSGEFVRLADGFTVYVEEVGPGGQLKGLLVNDYRNGGARETYMAQKGLLQDTPAGPILQLSNGNIQRVARYTGQIEITKFDRTLVNVGMFARSSGRLQLELTERYLGELLKPDLSNEWDRANASLLVAEGHNRLASPLYVFAFALIALFAMTGGPYQRRGYALRIAVAASVAGALRLIGVLAQGLAASTGAYWLQYALPVAANVALFVLVARGAPRFVRAEAAPSKAELARAA